MKKVNFKGVVENYVKVFAIVAITVFITEIEFINDFVSDLMYKVDSEFNETVLTIMILALIATVVNGVINRFNRKKGIEAV